MPGANGEYFQRGPRTGRRGTIFIRGTRREGGRGGVLQRPVYIYTLCAYSNITADARTHRTANRFTSDNRRMGCRRRGTVPANITIEIIFNSINYIRTLHYYTATCINIFLLNPRRPYIIYGRNSARGDMDAEKQTNSPQLKKKTYRIFNKRFYTRIFKRVLLLLPSS